MATIINIYKYTNKDVSYRTQTGVYHDSKHKRAVATDAHILIASTKHYNENFAEQIIDKDGKDVSIKDRPKQGFPNYTSVKQTFPKLICDMFKMPADLAGKIAAYKKARKEQKFSAKQTRIFVRRNFIDKEDGTTHTICFKYEYLKMFLDAAKYIEAKEIWFIDKTHSIQAKSGDSFVLVMPVIPIETPDNIDNPEEPFYITI